LETLRRLIHIAGVSTIVLTELVGKTGLSLIVLSTTVLYLISEYLRLHGKHLPVITKITSLAARGDESSGWILCPVSYAVGIMIAVNIFPEPVNYAAISVLTLGDGVSSLVGIKFGRHAIPYNRNKTFEGSISCFLSSFFSALIFVNPFAAFLGSIVGTFVESLPTGCGENIVVPTASGLCMSIPFLFM
jgi:dolichol kinase